MCRIIHIFATHPLCSAAVCSMLWIHGGWGFISAVFLASFLVSVAMVMYQMRVFCECMRFFCILALGVYIGGLVHSHIPRANLQWMGMTTSKVNRVHAVVHKEPFYTSSGSMIMLIRIFAVSRKQGASISTAEAGGIIAVPIQKREETSDKYALGDEIEIAGRIKTFHVMQNTERVNRYAISVEKIVRIKRGPLVQIRHIIRRYIYNTLSILPPSQSSLAYALILGDKTMMPVEQERIFKISGAAHVLVLSGFHLGIIFSATMFLMGMLRIPIRMRYCSAIVFAFIYVYLAGASPSLVRALCMYGSMTVCRTLRWKAPLSEHLGVTVLILILVFPLWSSNAGFILSILGLGGIIVVSTLIYERIKPFVPNIIAIPISVSAGAFMSTAPYVYAIFGHLYPIGIVASIPISMVVGVFIGTAVALLLMPFGTSYIMVATDIVYRVLSMILALSAKAGPWRILFPVVFTCAVILLLQPFICALLRNTRYEIQDAKYKKSST